LRRGSLPPILPPFHFPRHPDAPSSPRTGGSLPRGNPRGALPPPVGPPTPEALEFHGFQPSGHLPRPPAHRSRRAGAGTGVGATGTGLAPGGDLPWDDPPASRVPGGLPPSALPPVPRSPGSRPTEHGRRHDRGRPVSAWHAPWAKGPRPWSPPRPPSGSTERWMGPPGWRWSWTSGRGVGSVGFPRRPFSSMGVAFPAGSVSGWPKTPGSSSASPWCWGGPPMERPSAADPSLTDGSSGAVIAWSGRTPSAWRETSRARRGGGPPWEGDGGFATLLLAAPDAARHLEEVRAQLTPGKAPLGPPVGPAMGVSAWGGTPGRPHGGRRRPGPPPGPPPSVRLFLSFHPLRHPEREGTARR
jgi:hypothetical protein